MRLQIIGDLITSSSSLTAIRESLLSYKERESPLPAAVWSEIQSVKNRAVENGAELESKAAWCLEAIARAQDYFIQAFHETRDDRFYEGWCTLERCELTLASLRRHYRPDDSSFGVSHMERHVLRLQGLYPYSHFLSPAYIVQEAECSICHGAITLRGGCDHVIGEIYGGEICHRIVTEGEFLEVSLVTNPVQKYSVVFAGAFNYGAVHYVLTGLQSPWSKWRYERIEIETDSNLYPGTARNDQCPCGSERKHKRCCLGKKRLREHFEVEFADPLPVGFPPYIEKGDYWVADESARLSSRLTNTKTEGDGKES